MSHNYSDQEIIKGIKVRDRKVLAHLYQHYYPMILDFTRKNSGNEDDARDLFQEGLVVIFEKVTSDQLRLSSAFRTYLYAVCRNKWLMVLRRKRTGPQMIVDTEQLNQEIPEAPQDCLRQEQFEVYRKHFEQLSSDCQKVLKMFFKGHSLKEIAQEMGFTEAYAKKRKFTCQKHLILSIEEDSLYQELKH